MIKSPLMILSACLIFSAQVICAVTSGGNFIQITPDINSTPLSPSINITGCCNAKGDGAYCTEYSMSRQDFNVTAPSIACQTAGLRLSQGYFPTNCAVQGDNWCTFTAQPGGNPRSLHIYQNVIVRSISPLLIQNLLYAIQVSATGWPANSPPSDWGFDGSGTVNFNQPNDHIQAEAVLANPELGCTALSNPSAISGKIALIIRGTCQFGLKMRNAQNAGAIGVIIINNVDGVVGMGPGTDGASVTIPGAMILQNDGQQILNALARGEKVSILMGNVV